MRLAVLRVWLRNLHLCIALALFVPLVAIGLSGSVLVFRADIAALLDPAPRLLIHPGSPHSVAEIIAAVEARIGDAFLPIRYDPPQQPGDPANVRLIKRDPSGTKVIDAIVDPATLNLVLWHPSAFPGPLGIVLSLHGNLLLGPAGRVYVGWLGVAMLVLATSGLVLWWPRRGRWRGAFTVDPAARGLRLQRELHGAIGIWTVLMLMTVASSGLYLVFPQAIEAGIRAVLPSRDVAPPAPIPAGKAAERISADRAIEAALSAVPSSRLVSLNLPPWPRLPYRVVLARAGELSGAPNIEVLINPWSAEPVGVVDPGTFAPAETVLAWQRPIHFGEGIGWIWRAILFLTGLLPAIFACTGIAMWLIRRNTRQRQQRSARA